MVEYWWKSKSMSVVKGGRHEYNNTNSNKPSTECIFLLTYGLWRHKTSRYVDQHDSGCGVSILGTQNIVFLNEKNFQKNQDNFGYKVLFTDRCRWQNFRPSLLLPVDRLYTVIHKTQKTRTKVLSSATDWQNFGPSE